MREVFNRRKVSDNCRLLVWEPYRSMWTAAIRHTLKSKYLRTDLRGRQQKEEEVDSSWNVTAHGDAREGKWRWNWRMEWVASTLHTTSEHVVSSITTADAHTSAASSRLNWRPCRFKWTHPFRRKTKSGFCACAITFQLTSTSLIPYTFLPLRLYPLPQSASFKIWELDCRRLRSNGGKTRNSKYSKKTLSQCPP